MFRCGAAFSHSRVQPITALQDEIVASVVQRLRDIDALFKDRQLQIVGGDIKGACTLSAFVATEPTLQEIMVRAKSLLRRTPVALVGHSLWPNELAHAEAGENVIVLHGTASPFFSMAAS